MASTQHEVAALVAEGYPVLADLRELYPSRHDRITAANEDFVRDHPDVVKGFLKGLLRGCHFVLDVENRPRFEEIIRTAGFLEAEHERKSYDGLYDAWFSRVSPDLSLPREGIERIVVEERRAGKLSASFDVEPMLRLDALKQAQGELGIA
jgi:ABC-type nitrate/sulfonate/bicarbonate transport system substrate-binding protein